MNLKTLVDKLNPFVHKTLESAATVCLQHRHYNIELEHWLLTLLAAENLAFHLLLRDCQLNPDTLKHDIHKSLENMRTGNQQTPAISPRIIELINEAWLIASLEYAQSHIHSGLLLLALLQNTLLRQICCGVSDEFKKLSVDNVKSALEKNLRASGETAPDNPKAETQAANGKALAQFTINLNEQARAGKLDAAIGRDVEIRQVIDILARRRQNNAILTGEPGVGKTAIVEGLALRIIQRDVPENLRNVVIHALDLGLLQAGASLKGEFENRLKRLIEEIKQAPHPIILFIDEAHTLIGAGNQAGAADAANLLKPALARGELRSIAATTWSEYKHYFEKDAALSRRFQVVKVEEPDTDTAIRMLRSLSGSLEKHHTINILDNAIRAAVRLSQRYISGRLLPDKAISVLDTACARVASQQSALPAEIESKAFLLTQLQQEADFLTREKRRGLRHQERLSALKKEIAELEKTIKSLRQQWHKEKNRVEEIKKLHEKLEKNSTSEATQKIKQRLRQCQRQLAETQKKSAFVSPYVDQTTVAQVIADWTGIPVGKMLKEDVKHILNLKNALKERVVGQDHALERITQTLQASAVKLTDPNKPNGVFLFVGPSGVGKTETALALAEALYGSENQMTVINLSEFKEPHKVSMLLGAPPGYVGYGEGGVLTEAVRRKPYSLVLLDEVEKAHSGVQDIFYQMFDKGTVKDGQGRDIDFRNTLIILTSNACADLISHYCGDPQTRPNPQALLNAIMEELSKIFKPAFLGRVTVVPYYSLEGPMLDNIIQLKLANLQQRMLEQHQIQINFTVELKNHIAAHCIHNALGARQIDNLLNAEIIPALSSILLNAIMMETKIRDISIGLSDTGKIQFT